MCVYVVLVKADLADVVDSSCSSGKTLAFTPVGRMHCLTSSMMAWPIKLHSFFDILDPNPYSIDLGRNLLQTGKTASLSLSG